MKMACNVAAMVLLVFSCLATILVAALKIFCQMMYVYIQVHVNITETHLRVTGFVLLPFMNLCVVGTYWMTLVFWHWITKTFP